MVWMLLVGVLFFFKQKTAYEMLRSLVGSEMCIRDSAGMICEQLGDWEGAARNYRAAAEGDPRSFVAPRALLGLGSCYEEMKRPADSKTAYEKIVSSYGAGGAKKEAESRLARAAAAQQPGTQ